MRRFKGHGGFLVLGLFLCLSGGCAHDTNLTQADIRLYGGTGGRHLQAACDSLICVSYNIQFSEEMDQAYDDLRTHPRLQQPDILLLQEMDAAGTAWLADRLGMNYYYYPSYIHPHHGDLFGNAVLSPWPLSTPRHLVLPHANPGTDNKRVALAVDVQIGERFVRVVNVHLSTLVINLADRLEQVAVIRDSLVSGAQSTIVGGDFNSGTPWEEVLFRRVLRKAGFKEARIPDDRTARGGPLDLLGYKLKLDHFFYRQLEFVSAGACGEATASDHFPIWSVYSWPD